MASTVKLINRKRMVMPPSYDRYGMKKGAWSEDEDNQLKVCIQRLDGRVPNWRLLPRNAGLKRCGKSCRLRWMNYLRPGLNRTKFSKLEHDLIIQLHNQLGNKWSAIALNFPGRTDNDIKNYWHAHVKKRRGADDRASRAQSFSYNSFGNDQQQSSDDNITSCITTLEEVVFHQVLPAKNPQNTGPLESNADSYNGEIFDIDLPPLIPEEELIGFQRDAISDYSKFFLEDLLIETVGEEFFSMGIW